MNVFIIGANGQVGRKLIDELIEKGEHHITVALRDPEQFSYFEEKNTQPVLLNLEDSVDAIVKQMKGADVVIFTAGSGSGTGYDKTLLIDLDGAVKTIEAAEQAGVTQYIMLSAFRTENRSTWNDSIKPYYVAKYYADQILENSGLNYTIVRPGALTNDEGKGTVSTNNSDDHHISRADVAASIAEMVGKENTYKKAINLLPGNIIIKELVKEI